MSMVLDKQSELIYNSTKKVIVEELKKLTFNLNVLLVEKKRWNEFKEILGKNALVLIREINRSQRNFKPVYADDLSSVSDIKGDIYFFDYIGENGSVRMIFQKGTDGYLRFNRIEEKIYEEVFSLF